MAKKAFLLAGILLIIDQIIKIWVKTNMQLEEQFAVLGQWFFIRFTENYGMAFGMEFGGETGKIILTSFRFVAILAIAFYIIYLEKHKAHKGLIFCMAMIFAGALGNLVDSMFYGMIFNDSYGQIATFLPQNGGYSSFMHGKVVDMFYAPIIRGHFPAWFPFWANQSFEFFRPIFNFADACITSGVFTVIIFQRKFFKK